MEAAARGHTAAVGTLCGFGGPGGTACAPFVLQPGEHIAAVEGRSGDYLDQIQIRVHCILGTTKSFL